LFFLEPPLFFLLFFLDFLPPQNFHQGFSVDDGVSDDGGVSMLDSYPIVPILGAGFGGLISSVFNPKSISSVLTTLV